jgi:hypothetical protein
MYLIRKLPTIGKRIALALLLCPARMMIDLSPKWHIWRSTVGPIFINPRHNGLTKKQGRTCLLRVRQSDASVDPVLWGGDRERASVRPFLAACHWLVW